MSGGPRSGAPSVAPGAVPAAGTDEVVCLAVEASCARGGCWVRNLPAAYPEVVTVVGVPGAVRRSLAVDVQAAAAGGVAGLRGRCARPVGPNGVADTTVRRATRATAMRMVTLLLTTSRSEGDKAHLERSLQLALMVDGEDDGSEDSEDSAEATSEQIIRSIESNVVDCLLRESPDDPARLKLLEGLEALKASVPPERYWPDLALTQMQQRLRKGLVDGASDPRSARHYFPDDVEDWLAVTGYQGDAGEKARTLCATATETLIDAAGIEPEGAAREMLLGHAEDLLQAGRWNRLLLARLDEARGHTAEAQAGYEQPGTPADISRILRTDAQWEQAAALDGEDEDLKWLLKVEEVAGTRPGGLDARLHEQGRRRLDETLERMRNSNKGER